MAKTKILIVDDDKEFLRELREILNFHGYEVVLSSNPASVPEIAANSRPAVILLDLKMDQTSGFELADELKHFTRTFDIPVIAMTGFFTESEHRALMNICGIRTCITKPFAAEEVITAIEKELAEHRPSQ